jgi:NodT family efflux transporter outer membrane factor (OMF) lipoprotein
MTLMMLVTDSCPPLRSRRVPLAACALALLTCCTVGPDYVTPEVDLPEDWRSTLGEEVEPGEFNLDDWWNVLDDPQLPGLVERAFAGNLTLKTALWRLEEAGARLAVATGQQWPDADARASTSRLKPSGNGLNAPPPGVAPFRVTRYQVGVDATWEMDVFGRVRRSIEAAQADYDGIVDDTRGVLTLLASGVTFAYGRARAFQGLHIRGARRAKRQQQTLELIRERAATEDLALELAMAERNLATTLARLPERWRDFESSVNALAVLLGERPGALQTEMAEGKPLPKPQRSIQIDAPANILHQRPDVRRAERRLAAETARIGVSTADLYPRFALFGGWSQEALQRGDLFDSESEGYGYGVGVRWHLFDGWRSENRVLVREARAEAALLAYEQAILSALLEVENALIAYEQETVRRDHLDDALEAAERAVEQAHERFAAGTVDFLNVLDAEREHFEVEQDWATSRGLVLRSLIRLFLALGGGWNDDYVFGEGQDSAE